MSRTTMAVVLSLVMVLATVAVGPAGALAGDAPGLADVADEEDRNGGDVAPGERFSGSVSVGEAEAEGEVDSRAFDKRVDAAETDDDRAGVVADQLTRVEERLAELEERRESLDERHDAGEISDREYRVRTAKLAAEVASVERMTNRSGAVAADIPNETLAANGVDAERIETLRTNAGELGGGEVSEIAQGIAGGGAGGAPNAPAGERGPPSDRVGGGGDAGQAGGGGASDDARNGTDTPTDDGSEAGGDADGAGNSDGPTGDEGSDTGSSGDGATEAEDGEAEQEDGADETEEDDGADETEQEDGEDGSEGEDADGDDADS